MQTNSPPPSPLFHMSLRIRLSREPRGFEAIADQLRRLGVAVGMGEPIRETPAFAIRELIVSCQQREQGEAVMKAVRAIDGAEIMNFALSR